MQTTSELARFAAAGAVRSGLGPEASGAAIISSSCSPPRSTFVAPRVRQSSTVVAPARARVLKKRKRRRGGAGDSGGSDDGGDGGSWGGGWGDGEGDGEEGQPWQLQNLWAWQVICICSLLQAAHHLLMQRAQTPELRGRGGEYAAVAAQ